MTKLTFAQNRDRKGAISRLAAQKKLAAPSRPGSPQPEVSFGCGAPYECVTGAIVVLIASLALTMESTNTTTPTQRLLINRPVLPE